MCTRGSGIVACSIDTASIPGSLSGELRHSLVDSLTCKAAVLLISRSQLCVD